LRGTCFCGTCSWHLFLNKLVKKTAKKTAKKTVKN